MHEHDIEQMVTAALYRNDCPSSMALGEYQRGFLAGDAAAQIADHLAFCTYCQADVAVLTTFSAMIAEELDETAVSSSTVTPSTWKQAMGYQWQRIKESGQLVIQIVDSAFAPQERTAMLAAVKSGRSSATSSKPLRNITLTSSETGDIDVSAVAFADAADETLCSLRVRVQIPNRWPDLAGVTISANSGTWRDEAVTNADGEVEFSAVPAELLDGLTITIV